MLSDEFKAVWSHLERGCRVANSEKYAAWWDRTPDEFESQTDLAFAGWFLFVQALHYQWIADGTLLASPVRRPREHHPA